MIEELERKQKETVVAYFKSLSENLYGKRGGGGNH
jgi:hypothetical protein